MKLVITGAKEIDRRLHALGPKVARQVVVGAMREVMKETIAPEVMADAPAGETGDLRRAVKVRAGQRSRKGPTMYVLIDGASLGDKFYAAFRELGTRFMKGSHFMKRAYDGKAAGAKDRVIRLIAKRTDVIVGLLNNGVSGIKGP